ncbi:MAG: hypothetical protein ACI8QD_001580 [Cyclobacteriaceae bacterium]|jgi:hypothetical protein
MYLIVPQKYWKTVIIMIMIGIVLIFSGRYLIRLGHDFSAEILKNLIKVETDGRYAIDFEEIKLSIRDKKLIIDKLSLVPIQRDEVDSGAVSYEVSIDKVVIHLESLKSIYLNRELSIDSVRIIDPSLKMLTNGRMGGGSFSTQTGDLYNLINDQLSVLRIGKFRVENADLKHEPSQFQLQDIAFSINDLLLDSGLVDDKVFYSNNIVLEINKQRLLLPDSVHEIGFEKFLLSTKDSVLRFKKVFIRPTKESGVTFKGKNDINVYDVNIPMLELSGIDYVKAYNDNMLSIDRVKILQPILLIDDESERTQKDEGRDNNLLRLMTRVFAQVEVNEFEIEQAKIDVKLYGGGDEQRLSSDQTNIAMFGIHLDTLNVVRQIERRFFDSARFTLLDYKYNLPDSIHQIKIDTFTLNTRDSSMRFHNLQVSPARNPNSANTLVWLDVPTGELTGAMFDEALLGNSLRLKDFRLQQPKLKINPALPRRRDTVRIKNSFSPEDLYALLNIRYDDFNSRSFKISQGDIEIVDQGSISDFNLSLQNISLSDKDVLWTDLINYLDVWTGDVSWKLDTLTVASSGIVISDKGQTLRILAPSLKDQAGNLSVLMEEFAIRGNKINLLIDGDFSADTFFLNEPSVMWNKINSTTTTTRIGLSDSTTREWAKKLKFLSVSNGSAQYLDDSILQLSVESVDLKINNDLKQPLDLLHFENLEGLLPRLKSGNYKVEALTYDHTSRRLDIEDVEIELKDSLIMKIGHIDIKQIFQKGIIEQQKLIAQSINVEGVMGLIDLPELRGILEELSTDSAKAKIDWSFLVSNVDLSIDAMHVKDPMKGHITISGTQIKLNDLSSAIYPMISDRSVLWSRSGTLMGTVDLVSRKRDSIQISNYVYSSDTRDFSAERLSIQDAQLNTALLDGLALTGIGVDALKAENMLIINTLKVDSSKVKYQLLGKDRSNMDKGPFHLPFARTQLSQAVLSNNQIELQTEDLSESRLLKLSLIQIDSLLLDSIPALSSWYDLVYELKLRGTELTETVGSDHALLVESYDFSLKDNQLSLEGIHLLPNLDRVSFSEQQDFQKSWFDIKVDQAQVIGLNYESIYTGSVAVDMIVLDNIFFDVYRDKTKPFPEGRSMPMPQKSLMDLNLPIWVDSLKLTGAIVYTEKPLDSDINGKMTFDQLDGYVTNIRAFDTLKSTPMILGISGKIYDAAPFDAMVSFSHDQLKYPYRMLGTVKNFDLTLLNQMLGPVAGVNIKSGYGENITFNFTGDDRVATGEMRFRYDDLKITILNKKTHDAQGLGSGIKTFFANTFVVKKKNPGFAIFLKKGEIFNERDTSRAIFNYWGKSLISGAVSSIGIKKSTKAHKRYVKKLEADLKEEEAALKRATNKK